MYDRRKWWMLSYIIQPFENWARGINFGNVYPWSHSIWFDLKTNIEAADLPASRSNSSCEYQKLVCRKHIFFCGNWFRGYAADDHVICLSIAKTAWLVAWQWSTFSEFVTRWLLFITICLFVRTYWEGHSDCPNKWNAWDSISPRSGGMYILLWPGIPSTRQRGCTDIISFNII
jgi:hypothetical protein